MIPCWSVSPVTAGCDLRELERSSNSSATFVQSTSMANAKRTPLYLSTNCVKCCRNAWLLRNCCFWIRVTPAVRERLQGSRSRRMSVMLFKRHRGSSHLPPAVATKFPAKIAKPVTGRLRLALFRGSKVQRTLIKTASLTAMNFIVTCWQKFRPT